MNIVILMGRLTKNPDISATTEGLSIARWRLAVDRAYKKDGGQSADFISCVAFGKQAEFAEKFLKQGTKIAVRGHWQTGDYTNKEGVKVYTNDCIIEQMEFAESKKGTATNSEEQGDFLNVPDGVIEELPFS